MPSKRLPELVTDRAVQNMPLGPLKLLLADTAPAGHGFNRGGLGLVGVLGRFVGHPVHELARFASS